MAVLISVGSNHGRQSCDARCYDAQGDSCDCVCGGVNHAQGLDKAQENTAEISAEILQANKQAYIPLALQR